MEYPFFRYFLNFLCILLARLVAGLRLFFFGYRLGVNNFPRVFSIYISVVFLILYECYQVPREAVSLSNESTSFVLPDPLD